MLEAHLPERGSGGRLQRPRSSFANHEAFGLGFNILKNLDVLRLTEPRSWDYADNPAPGLLLLLRLGFLNVFSLDDFNLRALFQFLGARHLDDVAGERRNGRGRRRGRRGRRGRLHAEQLDFKNQSRVWRDVAVALRTVGEFRR